MNPRNRNSYQARARRAWILTGFAVAAVLVSAAQASNTIGDLFLAVVALSAAGSVFWSLLVWRSRPRGAWLAIGASFALFMVTLWLRASYKTLGDLTASRSLVPDFFGVPGYILLGVGLALLVRSRRRHLPGMVDTWLDGGIAGLAALCMAWAFLIGPALASRGAPIQVRIALAIYPPMSVVLSVFSAQLAFDGRGGRRRPASFAAFTGMTAILIGDFLYTLADAGVTQPPMWLLNLAYGTAFASIIPLIWHPTSSEFSEAIPAEELKPTRVRLPIIGVALSIPALLASLRGAATVGDRVVFGVISVSLAALGVLRVIRAIAAQTEIQEVLRHQATHDALTGLPNRTGASAHLDERLAEAVRDGRPLAVLFLDLDRFKLVNDTYGHGMGDALLVATAERIRGLDIGISVAARIGGDEFVMVLSDAFSLEDAVVQAEVVRTVLAEPVHIDGVDLPSSASIGVAFADGSDPSLTGEEMLRDADTAMYEAKAAGRDAVVVFDAEMRDVVSRRLELETDLHYAAERGELEVVYQPIVALPSERITGFEALVRWHHPELGTVSPGEFIPIAEETGLIVKLGNWVLERAMEELASLRLIVDGGTSLTMAVNVSTRQLLDDTLVDRVADLLELHCIPDGHLYLEVTESVLMDDPAAVEEVLRRLRETGVRLSIDDFGTGYSSLAYLRRFPFDRVKIDRAFVDGLDRAHSSERSLITAIVAMATALGLDTVAEGVEQPGEAEALVSIGCTAAQGFYFWRPVSADQLPSAIVRLGVARREPSRLSNSK